MAKEDLKKRILEESDFIKSSKYSNSLAKYLSQNSKEIDDSVIAKLLMISEAEVEEIYQKSIDFIKNSVVDSEDGN